MTDKFDHRYRVALASRDEITSDGMIADPEGDYVRWDVSNAEYLALERVAYEMREALVARQEADATWKNDRTAHNVCHEMTKKADDLARTALAAFDKAKEGRGMWEDAHTENQWPSGRKKIVAEQGNIPIAEDLSNDLDRRSLAAAFAYKLVGKFPSIEQAVIAPSLMREAGLAFLALIERTSRAEAERDEYQAKSYRNMCRDQHMQIGFEGEDFQPCPVCQLQGEVAQLKAENERLKAPVSDEEFEKFSSYISGEGPVGMVQGAEVDALLTARTQGIKWQVT